MLLAMLSVLTLAASDVYSHGDDDGVLFVSTDGFDGGDCIDAKRPCRTLGYALSRIGKNGQVRVAEGTYAVSGAADLFRLLSGGVDIRGGFDAGSGFQRSAGRLSTLTGVPVQYAGQLADFGFHVVVDQKGVDLAAAEHTAQMLALHEQLQSSMPATPCTAGFAGGLPCDDVDLLSHLGNNDISARPSRAADVWGFVDLNTNREYAIVGFDIGTGVFDVTDPENPQEVEFIDGQSTTWRDIKVFQFWNAADARWNAHAYVTTDGSSDGLFVIDLSGLPHSVQQLGYNSDFTAAHNVYATSTDFGTGLALNGSEPTIVIAGSNNGSGPYRAYSLAVPAAPAFEVMPASGRSNYMHDAASMIITDARKDTDCVNATSYCEVLFDFNEEEIDIWDITATNDPRRLSRTPYAGARYVHSGWWSEDRQYLYVHDELDEGNSVVNTTMRVFSLADLSAPVQVSAWTGPTSAIDHNGFVRGNRYYMSNYTRGLTVLDLSDPSSPQAIGRLDTYPANDVRAFSGAWGVYPFFHSGAIAISDINSGLYLARDRTLDVAEGMLALSADSYGGPEGSQLSISVSRVGGTSGAVGVAYEIVPATGSSADVAIAGGTLNWADGDATDRQILIDLAVDAEVEPLERVLLRLVNPTGGATLAPGSVAHIYVSEPAAASSVEFDVASIDITERGFGRAIVVVQRRGSASGAVSVDYGLNAFDADAGADYQGSTSGTLDWADGDANPKWIEFDIVDDGVSENDEFIELALTNPSGAVIGAADTIRINIADGSGVNNAPNSIAGSNQTVNSGALVTLNGTQSNDPDGDALSYQWSQVSGQAVTLSGAASATATFTAPTVSSDTLLQFRLTVTDTAGLQSQATTSVTVRRVRSGVGGGGGSFDLIWIFALLALATGRLIYSNGCCLMIVCSRSGPVEMMSIGTPASSSMRSR